MLKLYYKELMSLMSKYNFGSLYENVFCFYVFIESI